MRAGWVIVALAMWPLMAAELVLMRELGMRKTDMVASTTILL